MGNIISVVGPNQAMVISGSAGAKDAKILVGGRAIIIPCIQRIDRLSLELRAISVESKGSMTSKGVSINVSGVCQVKVAGYTEVEGSLERDINAIRLAAQHFLGATDAEIDNSIRQTMEGHLRAILGTLTVEEVYRDRQAFSESVKEVATADLRNMGMSIVSFVLSSITDEEGYLEALGVSQTEQVRRDADIARSRNQAESAKKAANYDLDKTIEKNRALKAMEESNREVAVTKAKLQEEIGKAEEQATAGRSLEEAILRQNIVTQTIRQQTMEAEEGIIIQQKLGNQEKIRLQNKAMAESEALLTRKTKEAEALRIYAKAEAERITMIGEAEAAAQKKRNLVDLELLKGKADVYKTYGEAAIAVQAIEALPQVAENIAKPLSKTEKMVFIGGGEGGAGSNSFVADISKGIGTVTETVNAMTGVNISRMLSAFATQMEGGAGGPSLGSSNNGANNQGGDDSSIKRTPSRKKSAASLPQPAKKDDLLVSNPDMSSVSFNLNTVGSNKE